MNQKTAKILKKLSNYTNKSFKELVAGWNSLPRGRRHGARMAALHVIRGAQRIQEKVEQKKYIPTQREAHVKPNTKTKGTSKE